MQPCLYCGQPALVSVHVSDGDACNHAVTCPSCGKASTLSVNLALVKACNVQVDHDLPLFARLCGGVA